MHAFTFLGHFYLIDYIADPAPFITRDVIDLQGNSIEFYRRNDKMADHARGLEVVFPPRRIRFGPFEADTRSGELRKHGIKVRLGQQTFQILLMLLDHPGEVVLREEIRLKLWPHDTVVEFDHSINAAIQKLREALGETAEIRGISRHCPGAGIASSGPWRRLQLSPRPSPKRLRRPYHRNSLAIRAHGPSWSSRSRSSLWLPELSPPGSARGRQTNRKIGRLRWEPWSDRWYPPTARP